MTADAHQNPSAEDVRADPRAPLWATFLLTWVNNIGASAALMGVYFVAPVSYGFTARDNTLLALLQGVTYIAGALTAGPLGRRIAGPGRFISTRGLTGLVMLGMALVCWLAVVWRSPWSIWVVVGVYSPLSGWLWPLIESFLASGRTGADLRRTTGAFNFSWASCQFVTFWLIARFMPAAAAGMDVSEEAAERALWSIPLLALSHVVSLVFLARLPKEPGTHHDHGDAALSAAQRALYAKLLTASRCLIVMGYVAYSASNPLLAARMEAFDVPPRWYTPLTSVWMISRVIMFLLMAVWHGWQGKRRTLAWSGGLLILGVTGILVAPDPWTLGVSLVLFGLGHGAIYSAAFYYAMEVGSAGVDAGGYHEALIGCGYMVGPLAVLGVAMVAPVESGAAQWPVALAVVGLGALAGVTALRVVRRGG